ncbi:Hypothetical predicted protein [Paramuricea clavata]|uniref:Uncharacterized protein n=1 Tax=Paramuricea clavata TaxID=317549 RepID=A0A7D9EYJ0_PARCT|nr:Hypothetical predicted protein [Paramuricea clavata]
MKGLIYVPYFTSTERDLVTSIAQHVLANAGPGETEYPWLCIQGTSPPPSKLKKTKRRRSRTGVTKTGVSKVKRSTLSSKATRGHGIPWRTAARVGSNRHRRNKRTWPFIETQDISKSVEDSERLEEKSEGKSEEHEEESSSLSGKAK